MAKFLVLAILVLATLACSLTPASTLPRTLEPNYFTLSLQRHNVIPLHVLYMGVAVEWHEGRWEGSK